MLPATVRRRSSICPSSCSPAGTRDRHPQPGHPAGKFAPYRNWSASLPPICPKLRDSLGKTGKSSTRLRMSRDAIGRAADPCSRHLHGRPRSATRKDFFHRRAVCWRQSKGSTPSGSGPVTSFVFAEEGEFRYGDISALTDRNAGDI